MPAAKDLPSSSKCSLSPRRIRRLGSHLAAIQISLDPPSPEATDLEEVGSESPLSPPRRCSTISTFSDVSSVSLCLNGSYQSLLSPQAPRLSTASRSSTQSLSASIDECETPPNEFFGANTRSTPIDQRRSFSAVLPLEPMHPLKTKQVVTQAVVEASGDDYKPVQNILSIHFTTHFSGTTHATKKQESTLIAEHSHCHLLLQLP
uniref:Uncharacterized protein n=1 Tax=Ditylenchus dipsaci TaxID=166011 RepID=A0A915CNZ9_9BILA